MFSRCLVLEAGSLGLYEILSRPFSEFVIFFDLFVFGYVPRFGFDPAPPPHTLAPFVFGRSAPG